ncbi:MAG: pyruvate kinase [Patescibacteria group bacterium]|nr:pyruvate kinase [bacterium]MDZ4240958.1 pyruvate kinase [Patescibacteria group bacterium]
MLLKKKTKIIATIGPVTENEKTMTAMLDAGLNVIRLNFSHGSHPEHQHRINLARNYTKKTGKPVAVLQDLCGPKIRTGDFYVERVTLIPGEKFIFTTEKIVGDEKRVSVNYEHLPKEVKKGMHILLDDGKKKFKILKVSGKEIHTKILTGGELKGRRGLNVPGAYLSVSSMTPKDKKDLEFGIKNGVDFVALSFVRRSQDIKELRAILDKKKSNAGIIAKIETPEAVDHIDEIIRLSDGVMIARGDLAIEVPAENVPLIQKMIIKKCNRAGKPVITATQMLESMIKSPVPTRAEVSDIANAILDGTDAIMLSEETTLGEYPVEAIEVMSRVALHIENDYLHKQLISERRDENSADAKNVTDSVTASAVYIAEDVGARFIIAFTNSGFTARMLCRYKPEQNIVVLTPNASTFQKLTLSFGCYPVLVSHSKDFSKDFSNVLFDARNFLLKNKLAKKGERIVVATGVPFGNAVRLAETNLVLVEEL